VESEYQSEKWDPKKRTLIENREQVLFGLDARSRILDAPMTPIPIEPAVVTNTDKQWFEHFRPKDQLTVIDEVNFWRPLAQ
jgi:hypothetical protein